MTRVESMQRSLIVLGCLGCVAYFAIWACAPVHHMRPPVPVAQSGESEFGFAVGTDTRESESRVFRRGPLTAMAWWQGVFFDGSMRFGILCSAQGLE